jgi:hypothetical protein
VKNVLYAVFISFILLFYGCTHKKENPKKYAIAYLSGKLADADVEILKIDDNGSLSLVETKKTSNSGIFDDIGKFEIDINSIDNASIYVFRVKGGECVNIDKDNASKFTTFKNVGEINLAVQGRYIKILDKTLNISALSQIQFLMLRKHLKNYNRNKFINTLNKTAKSLLSCDINFDKTIDQKDIAEFNPFLDKKCMEKYIKENMHRIEMNIERGSKIFTLYVGSIDTLNYTANISSFRNYLYISQFNEGIEAVDFKKDGGVKILGYMRGADYVRGLAVSRNYLYAADSIGLKIIDISNPFQPNKISSLDIGASREVLVKNNYAYVANAWNRFYCVDVENQHNPKIILFLETSRPVNKMVLHGNYIFAAIGEGGVETIDIKNPKKPRIVSKIKMSYANSLYADGNYLYIADLKKGVFALDINNVLTPHLKPIFKQIKAAADMVEYKNLFYIVDADGNLYVANSKNAQILQKLDVKGVQKVYKLKNRLLAATKNRIYIIKTIY